MAAQAWAQGVRGARRARVAAELSARREAQLVRRAQRGETEAVEELFAHLWPRCHRAAWLITQDRAAAEDVAQEGLVAAIAALDRFDRSRRLWPWLRTIVARRAIDHARARAARREITGEQLPEPEAPRRPPDGLSEPALAALGELGVERRSVVVLRFLLEMTPREIARLQGVPVGTVNSRMRRALDELRELTESSDG
jgi:RNA polymerase sigma-70 factor (ECF subfamily)